MKNRRVFLLALTSLVFFSCEKPPPSCEACKSSNIRFVRSNYFIHGLDTSRQDFVVIEGCELECLDSLTFYRLNAYYTSTAEDPDRLRFVEYSSTDDFISDTEKYDPEEDARTSLLCVYYDENRNIVNYGFRVSHTQLDYYGTSFSEGKRIKLRGKLK